MAFKKNLVFANYTLLFGDNLKLLDLFEQVVLPAYRAGDTRYLRGTNYFFLNINLTPIYEKNKKEAVDMVLSGRFVKNTKLRRDQIYRKDKGIVQDKDELESAPTSLFALTLKNHRLVYMKEVAGAPDIKTFETTSQKFLSDKHREFIDNKYIIQNERASLEPTRYEKITKKKLIEEYPYPDLRVTPLSDRKSLKEFVYKFNLIEELTIKLLPTNDEDIDNDGFWNQLDDSRNRMGSKNVTTRFVNKNDGLEQNEVYQQTEQATGMANSEINLRGTDHSGGKLRGDNESFQLTVEKDDISGDVPQATKQMYSEYSNQVESGNIKLGNVAASTIQKLSSIIKVFV